MTSVTRGKQASLYWRALTDAEIAAVAGGGAEEPPTKIEDVVVIAEREDDDATDRWWLDYNWDDPIAPPTGGGGGGGGDADSDEDQPDTELSEEDLEDLQEIADGLIAILEENIRKYGDFTMKLPNGAEFRASALLESLGKFSTYLEAGTLAYEAARGNVDVGAVAGFLGGLAAGAVAGFVGAGPLAVFAASLAVGWSVEYLVDSIGQNLETALEQAFAQQTAQNPGVPPSVNYVHLIMQMFGYDGPPPGAPGGGSWFDGGDPGVYTGGGGTDPNYGGLYNIP